MSDESVKAMHRHFLQQIRAKLAALREEVRTLEAVESYHDQQITENGGQEIGLPTESQNHAPRGSTSLLARRLRAAKKHDAAAIALRHIGRPAKIGEIIDVLWQNGYETNMQRRVLHNTLYTGMNRRKDMFRKLSAGLWNLRGEPEDDEGDTEE